VGLTAVSGQPLFFSAKRPLKSGRIQSRWRFTSRRPPFMRAVSFGRCERDPEIVDEERRSLGTEYVLKMNSNALKSAVHDNTSATNGPDLTVIVTIMIMINTIGTGRPEKNFFIYSEIFTHGETAPKAVGTPFSPCMSKKYLTLKA